MFYIDCKTNGKPDCKQVFLDVNSDLPCELCVQVFSRDEESQHAAQLLTTHIRKKMAVALSDIRRTAYEQGWKDAKGRKRKATLFGYDWSSRGAI